LTEFEEKILNLLEKIDEKLDKLLGSKKSGEVGTKAVITTGEGYVKPSAVVEKQEEEQKAIEKPPVEGRRVCPACGGTVFNTEEDKSQVLFQQGGMKIYAKKYICKSCGTEA
jgi:uncharacterized protein with PIN domain